jgi:hypothetical protein
LIQPAWVFEEKIIIPASPLGESVFKYESRMNAREANVRHKSRKERPAM